MKAIQVETRRKRWSVRREHRDAPFGTAVSLNLLARLPRTIPMGHGRLWWLSRSAQQAMGLSEIVNGAVGGIVDHPDPCDKKAHHCDVEFCALLTISADLSVKSFEVSAVTRFHGAAIQQSRQFFGGHPDLGHGVS